MKKHKRKVKSKPAPMVETPAGPPATEIHLDLFDVVKAREFQAVLRDARGCLRTLSALAKSFNHAVELVVKACPTEEIDSLNEVGGEEAREYLVERALLRKYKRA